MTSPPEPADEPDARLPWDAARWYPGLWRECPDCEGRGTVDAQRCAMCGGQGGWSD